jgi:hypothetical protein
MSDWDNLVEPTRGALEALLRKGDEMADRIEVKAAAARRLRRKLEILKLDAAKSRGQLFHDLQECLALIAIIENDVSRS